MNLYIINKKICIEKWHNQFSRKPWDRSHYVLSYFANCGIRFDGYNHYEAKVILYATTLHFVSTPSKQKGKCDEQFDTNIHCIIYNLCISLKWTEMISIYHLSMIKYIPFIRSRALHLSLIALLVGCMSIEGYANLKKQHDTVGKNHTETLNYLAVRL